MGGVCGGGTLAHRWGFCDIAMKLAGDLKHAPSDSGSSRGKRGARFHVRGRDVWPESRPHRACGSFQTGPLC